MITSYASCASCVPFLVSLADCCLPPSVATHDEVRDVGGGIALGVGLRRRRALQGLQEFKILSFTEMKMGSNRIGRDCRCSTRIKCGIGCQLCDRRN
jgi:hypothetical protein